MSKEKCVICGVETSVDVNTHIDFRDFYEEGLGQMCPTCGLKTKEEETICIPVSFITKYPNNYELGEQVRKLLK